MRKPKVVFLGPYKFPGGDATSNRVMGLAQITKQLGYDVKVLGVGDLRLSDKKDDGRFIVDGIEYDSLFGGERLSVWQKSLRLIFSAYTFPRKLVEKRWLDADIILISVGYMIINSLYLVWIKWRYNTKFMVDSSEWYSKEQFEYPYLNPGYLQFLLGFHVVYPLTGNVITISSRLTGYFSERGCNTLCIPPVLDINEVPWDISARSSGEKIRLIYAGVPGKKDYMGNILEGISQLEPAERQRVEFHIYGPTEGQLAEIIGGFRQLKDLADCVTVHGRVSRQEIFRALSQSDFMVLVRPQMRFANSGFPSKVPESLAAGTPVMLNYTSDLHLYIRDGYEGIVIDDCSSNAVTKALKKALDLSAEQLQEMRREARACAERYFDYRVWVEPMNSFLTKID